MIKRFLINTTKEHSLLQEIAMTSLRVFVGLSFAFAHGLGKIPPGEQLIAGVTRIGLPAPFAFAWAAALAEFLGGILLALGLLTRPAAFFLALTMLVAAFGAHASDPFRAKELALVYFFVAFVFYSRGAGKYSVDNLIR